ncbi:MAG: hypothetical protein WD529_05000 [Balneolaceae bacterium]
MGTTGLAAQAYGRKDHVRIMVLARGLLLTICSRHYIYEPLQKLGSASGPAV